MIQKIQDHLSGVPKSRLWLVILGYVIIVVELLVGTIDYLIWGHVTWDYLLTGFLSALPVTALQVSFITHILDQNEHTKKLNAQLETEISERKLREQELRISATAFETQESMIITDIDGVILKVNQAFINMSGFSANEILGKRADILVPNRHKSDDVKTALSAILETGRWDGEFWCHRKGCEIQPLRLRVTAVKTNENITTHYVATMTDFTMSQDVAEEIKQLAFYDYLTRLPNRRLLRDRLDHALANCARNNKKGALLFIDLDKFKDLNDTLGHDTGDLLLQLVSTKLLALVRQCDTVARVGGDEFVILIENLNTDDLQAIKQVEAECERIFAAFVAPYQLMEHHYLCSVSIGATLFDGHQVTGETLLKQADIAMYQAKTSGRNQLCFFANQLQENVSARVSLERDLQTALETNQFQLYYQIQVDSKQTPMGAEALIRWPHPKRGLVHPLEFIPVAEESSLIIAIGYWVLTAACKQLSEWERNPLTSSLTLAINVSAKQFHQNDFVDQVIHLIHQFAIDPEKLELELTESLLQEDIESVVKKMNTLRVIGIRFSLDDFGTGYSSLQYLKKLPLNQLKIDQSFVRELSDDASDRAIVRTIIAMAKTLGLQVIAEGVETSDQLERLINKGCSMFQGYYFGRPSPIEVFEQDLKSASKVPHH